MPYAGRGTVAINFCKITLSAWTPDQTLTALTNTCTRAAPAQLIAQGKSLTIMDPSWKRIWRAIPGHASKLRLLFIKKGEPFAGLIATTPNSLNG